MHQQLLIQVILAVPTFQTVLPRQFDAASNSRPAGDIVRNFFGRLGQGASNVLNVNKLNAQKVAYGDERNQVNPEPSIPSMDVKREVSQQTLFRTPPTESNPKDLRNECQIPLASRDRLLGITSGSSAQAHDKLEPVIRRDKRKLTATTFLDNAALATHIDPGAIDALHDQDHSGVHAFVANNGVLKGDLLKQTSHDLGAAETILQETVLAGNPSSSTDSPGGTIHNDAVKQGSGQAAFTDSILQDQAMAVHLSSLKDATRNIIHDAVKQGSGQAAFTDSILQDQAMAVHLSSLKDATRNIIHDDAALTSQAHEKVLAAQPDVAKTDTFHSSPMTLVTASRIQDGSSHDSPVTKAHAHPPIKGDFARPDHWPDKRQLMQGNNVLNAIVRWLPTVEEIGVRATYDEYRTRAEPAKEPEPVPVANSGLTIAFGWRRWCFVTAVLVVRTFL